MTTAYDPGLPPGVHPLDPRGPEEEVTPLDAARPMGARRQAPWSVENEDAVPVFQRLAESWDTGVIVLGGSGASGDSIKRVAQKQKGRTYLGLWVPAQVISGGAMITTPAGVIFGRSQAALSNLSPSCTPLNVGDAILVPAEGDAWVTLQPGASSGYVAYLHAWSPPGRGLDI